MDHLLWPSPSLAEITHSQRPSQTLSLTRNVSLPDLLEDPFEYLDLKEVFNKAQATSLLPYCPYDYASNLLLGISPLKSRLY